MEAQVFQKSFGDVYTRNFNAVAREEGFLAHAPSEISIIIFINLIENKILSA